MLLKTDTFESTRGLRICDLASHALTFVVFMSVMVALVLFSSQASAQGCSSPVDVDTELALNDAITCYNSVPAGSHVLNLSANITLSASATQINNTAGASLTINGNSNAIDGAGTYRMIDIAQGSVTIDNLTLQNGNGTDGGAVYVAKSASLTLTNSTVANSTANVGGGVKNDGTLNVANSVFFGNSSASGGAIRNNGTLQMNDSTLRNNSTTRLGEGGGLSNYGTAQVSGSTAYSNTGGFGAALYTRGDLTVVNSTLSGNTATGLAGGIYVFWTGAATVYNTTISDSSANTGGGVLNNGGTYAMHNSILANTTKGSNCYGTIGGSSSLVDDRSCGSHTQSSNINLGLLQDNGGATLTHAIGSDSAAFDAGNATICTATPVNNIDQRGIARPFNATCDIGAYEFFNAAPVLASIGDRSASEGQLLQFTATATDAEGHNLSFALANAPTGATLTDNGDGTANFNWTPSFEQAGNYVDVLIIVTDDGTGTQMHSETITINVGNVNRPPQFKAVTNQAAGEGVMMSIDVLATDPDHNPITLALANAPTGASFMDNGDGSGQLAWTPNFDQSGNYTVMFTATDDGTPAATDTLEVTFTVGDVNRPPVLSMIGSRTVEEGATLSFALAANDPDGDTLSYALGNGPQGASLTDNGDGTANFNWAPDFGAAGEYTNVLFTVTDGGSPAESDGEAISVTVGDVNRAPVLTPIGNRTVSEGELLEFVLTGSDPDGDSLAYTTLTALPEGANFLDNEDGTANFSWTPDFTQAGNVNVEFQVFDSAASVATASETVTISVGDVNRAPVLNAIGNRSVLAGSAMQFTLTSTDPDGDSLSYPTPGGLPAGATLVDNSDGTAILSWTPTTAQAGNHQVTFVVSDGSDSDSESLTLTATTPPGTTTTTSTTGSGGGGATGLFELLLSALALFCLSRQNYLRGRYKNRSTLDV